MLIFILILIVQNCDTTDPPNNDIEPGRRDYTWSVDSVSSSGYPYIKSIWGSSTTDVWGAGFSEDVRDCLWHYDGVSWSRATEGTPITTSGEGSPIVGGVWGTAQNDVWAFGGRRFSNPERIGSFVMHFDGENWTEVNSDNNMPNGLFDLYERNKDDLWIATLGEVVNYKNGLWRKYKIDTKKIILSISGYENEVFISSYPIGGSSLSIMKLEGEEFHIKDSTDLFQGKFGSSGLLITSTKIYTFSNTGIYSAEIQKGDILRNNWNQEIVSNSGGFLNSFLLSEKDIWAVGSHPFPYHYDGSDWQEISIYGANNGIFSNQFWGIWGNGEEIFICDIENGKIYHGKLK